MDEKPSSTGLNVMAYPFLGIGDDGARKIILLAPNQPKISEVTCELRSLGILIDSKIGFVNDETVRQYVFEFKNLKDGVVYNYYFYNKAELLDLGGGLEYEDLCFTHWDHIEASDSLLLMSCNGITFFKEKEIKKWNMWEELYSKVSVADQKPKILVLGGDQYYQDAMEDKWLSKLSNANFAKIRDEFKRDCLKNALAHMDNLAYRKIMAQIPSVAMLDDHDITDGAGGRDEHFVSDSHQFSEEWLNYLEVQKELFDLIQASRNPTAISSKKLSAYSCVVSFGSVAIVLMDLRTEKNSRKKMLMQEDSKHALFEAIEKLPHKTVMILSPVVPMRNSSKVEGSLHTIIHLISLFLNLKIVPKWGKLGSRIETTAKFIVGLSDDLNDSLSSECNKDFFSELLTIMGKGAERGTKYAILSGDIHTGGTVELFVNASGQDFRVPLIISSPIGYETMHPIVETFLRGKHVIEFSHNNVQVVGRNNLFTTNRNCIKMIPGQLFSKPNDSVYLFEEGLPGSQKLMTQFWEKGISLEVTTKKSIGIETDSRAKSEAGQEIQS